MIDFTAAWMTASVNAPYFLGNNIGTFRSSKAIYQGEQLIINGVSIYSTEVLVIAVI